MITTMAIRVADKGIELKGTSVEVTKHMLGNPRRIGRIDVVLTYPEGLQLSDEDKVFLKEIGDNCPVMKSIHQDIEVNAVYR